MAVTAMPNSPDDACRSRVTKNTFSALIAPVPHWQITVTVSSVTRNRLRANNRRPAANSAYRLDLSAPARACGRGPGASRSRRMARYDTA